MLRYLHSNCSALQIFQLNRKHNLNLYYQTSSTQSPLLVFFLCVLHSSGQKIMIMGEANVETSPFRYSGSIPKNTNSLCFEYNINILFLISFTFRFDVQYACLSFLSAILVPTYIVARHTLSPVIIYTGTPGLYCSPKAHI